MIYFSILNAIYRLIYGYFCFKVISCFRFKIAQHLRVLNIRKIPELSLSQRELNFDIEINKQGDHVFLVNYISKSTDDGSVTIPLIVEIGDKAQRGFVSLYPCKYTMLCRKVALNKEGRVAVFNLDNNYVKATLKVSFFYSFKFQFYYPLIG